MSIQEKNGVADEDRLFFCTTLFVNEGMTVELLVMKKEFSRTGRRKTIIPSGTGMNWILVLFG